MATIFSYCIYGSNPKYVEGMVKNLEQIQVMYPEFQTWIIVGNDVPSTYIEKYNSFPNVKLTHVSETGGRLMTYRFFPIDKSEVDCMIVRDADSRFGNRDQECIRRFMNSDYTLFTIRDHFYHKCPIMGGQWGIKRTKVHSEFDLESAYNSMKDKFEGVDLYGSDEWFTRQYLYTKYGSHMIAFSSIKYSAGDETIAEIMTPRRDDTDFCGNVYEFNSDGSTYPVFKFHA